MKGSFVMNPMVIYEPIYITKPNSDYIVELIFDNFPTHCLIIRYCDMHMIIISLPSSEMLRQTKINCYWSSGGYTHAYAVKNSDCMQCKKIK